MTAVLPENTIERKKNGYWAQGTQKRLRYQNKMLSNNMANSTETVSSTTISANQAHFVEEVISALSVNQTSLNFNRPSLSVYRTNLKEETSSALSMNRNNSIEEITSTTIIIETELNYSIIDRILMASLKADKKIVIPLLIFLFVFGIVATFGIFFFICFIFRLILKRLCCVKSPTIRASKKNIYNPAKATDSNACSSFPRTALTVATSNKTPSDNPKHSSSAKETFEMMVVENKMFQVKDNGEKVAKQKKKHALDWDYSHISLISETDSKDN